MAFAALSVETRLNLLRLLMAEGAGGLGAGNIADRLGLPASTASFHLAALERAGLTRSRRHGRHIVHSARAPGLRALLVYLLDAWRGGNPAIGVGIADLFPPLPDEDRGMTPSFNVLFLCTHNAARSIMAEAILARIGHGRFRAWSAGSDPSTAANPEVMAKLRALGHETRDLRPKPWGDFMGPGAPRMDFVMTLCDTPRGQVCPDFGGFAVTAAWPLPDPAKFHGGPVEQTALLNELYASLRRRLEIFVALPFAALDRMALKARLDELATNGLPPAARGH